MRNLFKYLFPCIFLGILLTSCSRHLQELPAPDRLVYEARLNNINKVKDTLRLFQSSMTCRQGPDKAMSSIKVQSDKFDVPEGKGVFQNQYVAAHVVRPERTVIISANTVTKGKKTKPHLEINGLPGGTEFIIIFLLIIFLPAIVLTFFVGSFLALLALSFMSFLGFLLVSEPALFKILHWKNAIALAISFVLPGLVLLALVLFLSFLFYSIFLPAFIILGYGFLFIFLPLMGAWAKYLKMRAWQNNEAK